MTVLGLIRRVVSAPRNLRYRRRYRRYLTQLGSPQEISRDRSSVLADGYYSQEGQDGYVHQELFPTHRNGVFVDVGANDGITFSNSYFFEKHLGWSGIAIEPLPATFEKLRGSRQCECLQLCAAESEGRQSFTAIAGDGEMLSGLTSAYDRRHLRRVNEFPDSTQLMVDCAPLSKILADRSIRHIDYLSIDTEGSELSVLKGIDWHSTTTDAITVENPYLDARIFEFLTARGYRCLARFSADELYISEGMQRTLRNRLNT